MQTRWVPPGAMAFGQVCLYRLVDQVQRDAKRLTGSEANSVIVLSLIGSTGSLGLRLEGRVFRGGCQRHPIVRDCRLSTRACLFACFST